MDDAGPSPTTALLTDHYELTMLAAARHSGLGERRCTFELFTRRIPPGRRYGVAVGLSRLLEAVGRFRFDEAALADLSARQVVDAGTLAWLEGYRFSGDIDGYAEGEPFFPYAPLVSIHGTFAECVVLETLALSIFNTDSAVAAAAARMRSAAGSRTLIEMGSRRANELAAPAAARAAWVCGFDASSNLEAGRRYGVRTTGTAAHAFTLGHVGFHPGDEAAAERAAFDAQLAALGIGTTLLVDTFDTEQGLRHALAAAQALGAPGPGAVRIDSGDLAWEAARARALLDEAGATATRIVVSGDLDEYAMAELAPAPVDAYGAGTRLVQGSGHPTAGMVFKLVAVDDGTGTMVAVAKRSSSKGSIGGVKHAYRLLGQDGRAAADALVVDGSAPEGAARPLQVRAVTAGEVVHDPSLDAVRAHHRQAMAELPDHALLLVAGDPALPTTIGGPS